LIDLTGRRVVVTGGSRGIGAACCRLFAQAGASVFIQYMASGDKAAAVLKELRQISDAPHAAVRCDVADPEEVCKLFDAVAARWGSLDCLINNAGVWVHDPLPQLQPERLQATLAVNIVGPFLCARCALPLLAGSEDASIINISSTAGQRGEAFYSAYAASKGALISATKSWSSELAPGIRVNAVAPGWVDTDMTSDALSGERRAAVLASIPLQRIATPEDIAGSVLFLASPLARHITGEILNVNGGSVLVG
jgi:3-oxoacyl-[acyl-carrier protein] reductase